MVRNILLLAALAVTSVSFADDFGGGTGGAIPDATVDHVTPGLISSTITPSTGGMMVTMFNSVTVFGLNHTWGGDVQISLTNGSNTVNLVHRIGSANTGFNNFGDSSNYGSDGTTGLTGRDYTFVNSGGGDLLAAFVAAGATVGVAAGTYDRSEHAFATAPGNTGLDFTVFNGAAADTDWTLSVRDWAGGDTGSFSGWSFNADVVPEPGSMAALVIGLGALAARRRNRK